MKNKHIKKIYEFYQSELTIKTDEYDGLFNYVYFEELDDESYLAYRIKQFSDINDGEPFYEIHINLSEKYQRKGYAVKMIKSFLSNMGGVAYISYGRIINPYFYRVIEKIKKDDNFVVEELKDGFLIYEV